MPYKDAAKRNECAKFWRRDHPEVSKRWRDRHPEQAKSIQDEYDAQSRYGLTAAQAKELRSRKCEICGRRAKKMCVDHDGSAEVFNQTYRGVLCQQCNTRLGWFEKYKDIVLTYLKRGPQDASRESGTTAGNGDSSSRARETA